MCVSFMIHQKSNCMKMNDKIISGKLRTLISYITFLKGWDNVASMNFNFIQKKTIL